MAISTAREATSRWKKLRAVGVFPAGDGHVDAGSDFGQAFRVSLRIYGLLEPTDVELSQFFSHGEGGFEVEAAVAVDQQGDVGADGVPRGGQAVEAGASEICKVSSGSARIHLVEWRALDGAKAVADGAFGGGREVTGASGGCQQAPIGVGVELDGGDRLAAQRPGERYALALGPNVYQRGAQRADGGGEREVLVELPRLESSYAHQVSLVVDGSVFEGLHERGETAGQIAAGGGFDDGRTGPGHRLSQRNSTGCESLTVTEA